ncbi:MAG: peptide chain release factor 2 [Patescibacteria group bacterium]
MFDNSDIHREIEDLEGKTTTEDFWKDKELAQEVYDNLSSKKKRVKLWNDLWQRVVDLEELLHLLHENSDEKEIKEIDSEYWQLKKDFDQAEIALLLHGEYDSMNCFLSIHSGTGGVEAQDWAEMLLRMYLRYCERRSYKTEIISIMPGEEAGIKSVILQVKGEDAYGYLRTESGVHRLVRLSPFNAKNLRQTSFALVEVLPIFDKKIEIEIPKDDLKIDTFRASGHGGQKVNKTDSAVRITHLPTGLVTTCQSERSQLQNKERALMMLKSKLYTRQEQQEKEKETLIKGAVKQGSWGNQIRSYVLHPYQMVKDHRTNFETSQTQKVLDGELDEFIEEALRKIIL